MLYIYAMEYYSAITKDEILPLATTWMDLELSQTKKVENHRIPLICGI